MEQAEKDSPGGSLIDISVSSDAQINPSRPPEGAADTFGFILLETTASEMTPAEAAEKGCGFVKFVYSRATLAANTTTWMQNLYLAPSDLVAHSKMSDAEAFYVPFYLFDVQTKSTVTAVIPPEQKSSSAIDDVPLPQQVERSFHNSSSEHCSSHSESPRGRFLPPLWSRSSLTPQWRTKRFCRSMWRLPMPGRARKICLKLN
jgi:hypothetical protein